MARRGKELMKRRGWELEFFVEKDFFKKFTGVTNLKMLNYLLAAGCRPSVALFKRSAMHFSFEERE